MIAISDAASPEMAVIARDLQARILNYSPSGCLLETNARIDVGTVGTLRFLMDGREFADHVQIVRCQPIEGAGSLFQVGVRFLLTTAGGEGTLRQALWRPPARGDDTSQGQSMGSAP